MRLRCCVASLAVLGAACGDDNVVTPPPGAPCAAECQPVSALEDAYQTLDPAAFEAALHPDYSYVPNPGVGRPVQPVRWDAAAEIALHRRMFAPQSVPSGEPAVPADLQLQYTTVELSRIGSFTERPQYYASATNPGGLDPAHWKALGATYATSVIAATHGDIKYQISGRAELIVAQDLTKSPGAPGEMLLYEWADGLDPTPAAERSTTAGIVAITWTGFKNLYRLPSAVEAAWEIQAVLTRLSLAYQRRDYALYTTLFHHDFLFILRPDPFDTNRPLEWDRTEELRIHRRMFRPDQIPPNETPVRDELWLAAVSITLSQARSFNEAPEYYQSPINPVGLDPARWRVWGTDYNASVLFETRGETDYQVTGNAYFVVVQDLALVPGAPGSMLVYRWQDLGAYAARNRPVEWSSVKMLYK